MFVLVEYGHIEIDSCEFIYIVDINWSRNDMNENRNNKKRNDFWTHFKMDWIKNI